MMPRHRAVRFDGAMPGSVRIHRWRGVAAVTLASGELQATFVPEMNMLGVSVRLGGDEFLALPGGVGAYRRVRTTDLPLLAPWANRLSQWAYRGGTGSPVNPIAIL
jgi:hypothetical protein